MRRCAIASATAAGSRPVPDLLEPNGNAFDAAPHEGRIAVSEVFGADVDDPARVDHVIGRVKNIALVEPLAILGGGKLIVGAAGNYRDAQLRDRAFVEDCAERTWAQHIGFDRQDLVRGDDLAAGAVRKLLRLRLVHVRNRKRRAFRAGVKGDPGSDASGALQRDVKPLEAVLPQRPFDRGLDAEEHAERCVGAWIATDVAGRVGEAGDIFRRTRDLDHVGDAHSDVFSGDIAAGKLLDGLAECVQQVGRLAAFCIGEDHGFAAAQRKARHRILVTHPARQPQRIDQRFLVLRVVPEARAARRRTEMRRVNGDDRLQSALVVGDEMDRFVLVEVGQAPGRGHRMR
jgi:hypothetical protein